MGEKKNFALVRKPSSAVERAAPGAKRILSGMVADALVLAQNVDADVLYQKYRIYRNLRQFDYAHSLLRRSAELGHSEAIYHCGLCCLTGESGFSWDPKQSFNWVLKAAERGYKDAQFHIGVLYTKPPSFYLFLSQDLSEAYKWLKLASDQDKSISEIFRSHSSTMTSNQLQEGERRYGDFRLQK